MDTAARVTSKGQVTIPRSVREALGIRAGDALLFRVEQGRAVIASSADLLDLAGSVPVPATKRGTPWSDVRRQVRRSRGRA